MPRQSTKMPNKNSSWEPLRASNCTTGGMTHLPARMAPPRKSTALSIAIARARPIVAGGWVRAGKMASIKPTPKSCTIKMASMI